MSRTYRFKSSSYMGADVLGEWCMTDNWTWYRVKHEPSSKEGKKRLARHRSDKKWGFYKSIGPSWFHNMFAQRPYRRDIKKQLHRYVREEEFEVQLLRRPKREYWT